MNKAALTKHQIYNKLAGLSEKELTSIADYVDFMRHQKKISSKKVLKLQGIIKGQDIDLYALKKFKEETWRHLDREFADE